MKDKRYRYVVAKMAFELVMDVDDTLNTHLQPYHPFIVDDTLADCANKVPLPAFVFTVVPQGASIHIKVGETPIADFDEEGQRMQLYRSDSGEYGILMTLGSESEGRCKMTINRDFTAAHLVTEGSEPMRVYGFNSGMMMMFAFAGAVRHILLIHSSVIKKEGRGYLFLGKSGTGKSTHSSLWLKHISGTELLNDDNPALGLTDDGTPIVYGTPWSGKTPCYRNIEAEIGGFVNLHQAPYNQIKRLGTVMAYTALLPAVSNMKWERSLSDGVNDTINKIISSIPIFSLECLPDEAAAQMSFHALTDVQR